ncbi:fibritin protein [Yersinia phage MHG19]|nr:fibritin protein [Yersinia phage MHG19]
MIEKLELKPIPFVDTVPDDDQKRIQWVRNGECLNAAETKTSSDGTLNKVGVQIQKNIEVIDENMFKTKEKVNILSSEVNRINESLNIENDTSLVEQIGINRDNINILQEHMQFAENDIGEMQASVEFLDEEVGVHNPEQDPVHRTVRDDLTFVKTEMGAYPGQDMNGNEVPGGLGTGMKRRIIDIATQAVKNEKRINQLEVDFDESDVGQMTLDVRKLRKEIGPSSEVVPDTTIYSRIKQTEKDIKTHSLSLAEIEEAIDLDGGQIIDHVNNNRDAIRELEKVQNDPKTGLTQRLTTVEGQIGSKDKPTTILGKLETDRKDINNLQIIVGKDSSSGLRGNVAWINQTVGIVDDTKPVPEDSILGQIQVITSTMNEHSSSIQDIQQEIGNNKEGLKGSVVMMSKTIYGTNPNGSTVEERGLVISVKQNEAKIASKLDDAPNDGMMYFRQNGAWVQKPFAIAEISDKDLKATLSTTEESVLDLDNFDVSHVNGLEIVDDNIVIHDTGTFNVRIQMIVAEAQASSQFDLIVKVNNVVRIRNSVGISTIGGRQMNFALGTLNITSGDKVSITMLAQNEESAIEIDIPSCFIAINPAL